MEQVRGEPWPAERSRHAACCLNFGEYHPHLLVSGGTNKEKKILADMWILDVDNRKWKEVRTQLCLHLSLLLHYLSSIRILLVHLEKKFY